MEDRRRLRRSVEGFVSDEYLVEEARARRRQRLSPRDLVVTGLLAAGFVVCAAVFVAALPWHHSLSSLTVAALVAAYALLSRVEFEVGPGSAVPIQLAFVPMVFALPLPLVPLCVAAGYLLGALPEYLGGRINPTRGLVLVASSWYSVLAVALGSLDGRPGGDRARSARVSVRIRRRELADPRAPRVRAFA